MKHFGLIGKELSHSVSPKLHQAISEIFNLSLTYELIDISAEEIPNYIDKLKKGIYHGFNVTMPYKTLVMTYLDEVSPNAQKMGAVNTIYLKDGKICGDNTDYYGIKETIIQSKVDVKDKEVYILGSGGAAKSGYVALEDLGAIPIVCKRKEDETTPLFKKVISYDEIDPRVDIFVQATPVGMYPHVNESILPSHKIKNKIVFDYIYNPLETQIMKDSKLGFNGLLIVIVQAFYSEALWHDRILDFEMSYVDKIKGVIL